MRNIGPAFWKGDSWEGSASWVPHVHPLLTCRARGCRKVSAPLCNTRDNLVPLHLRRARENASSCLAHDRVLQQSWDWSDLGWWAGWKQHSLDHGFHLSQLIYLSPCFHTCTQMHASQMCLWKSGYLWQCVLRHRPQPCCLYNSSYRAQSPLHWKQKQETHWNRLSREVAGSAFLEVIRKRAGVVLSDMVWNDHRHWLTARQNGLVELLGLQWSINEYVNKKCSRKNRKLFPQHLSEKGPQLNVWTVCKHYIYGWRSMLINQIHPEQAWASF